MPDTVTAEPSPAARLADLTAQLAAARREQAEAVRASQPTINGMPHPDNPDPSQTPDALFARRRTAESRVRRLEVELEIAHAAAVEALEVERAPLLADLDHALTAAGVRLADAVQAALDALAAAADAAEDYRRQIDAVREQLSRAGFDRVGRARLISSGHDPARFPTHDAGGTVHLGTGTPWPVTVSPAAAVALVVARGAGTSCSSLAGFARGVLQVDQGAVEAVLARVRAGGRP